MVALLVVLLPKLEVAVAVLQVVMAVLVQETALVEQVE
jgi:hypothetical protein